MPKVYRTCVTKYKKSNKVRTFNFQFLLDLIHDQNIDVTVREDTGTCHPFSKTLSKEPFLNRLSALVRPPTSRGVEHTFFWNTPNFLLTLNIPVSLFRALDYS